MRTHIRRFKLSDTFIDQYRDREVPWGPLGYVTFKRTYARRLSEFETDAMGTEEWYQTCRRVIEGMFEMQKQHVYRLGLEWNDNKAQKTAKDAYERLFTLKWTPPGRGLWMMGTKFVNERTAAGLFNCAFRSTRELSTKGGYLFSWMMDALMLGIGVGFDTLGAGTVTVQKPEFTNEPYIIDDSREGWVESVKILLNGFFYGSRVPAFDYSAIRPYGAPINGFGGTSSGFGPLKELHDSLTELYTERIGSEVTSVDIVDTENLIGRCVVAGNVRRSAALALGSYDDFNYLQMKNDSEKLAHHRWGSNNSFHAIVGQDYTWHAEQSQKNGEPGYIWLDNARTRGRFADPPRDDDKNVMGFNPCVTGDTWVATTEGYRQAKDLVGKMGLSLVVNGKPYKALSTGFWKTGNKSVFRLSTKEGYEVKLTADHKVLTENRGWVEAKRLRYEDKIVIHNHRELESEDFSQDKFNEGFLMGLLVGDGTFADGKAVLSFWDGDLMKEAATISGVSSPTFISDRNEWRIRREAISNLASMWGIKQGSKREIGHIMGLGESSIRGFLRGLFDADGTVIGTPKKGVSVRLSQNHLAMLKNVQRMLLSLGISSAIYQNRRPAGNYELPDGQGGYKLYTCKAMHELVISNEDIFRFNKMVGFASPAKHSRLDEIISSYKRKPNKTKFVARFEDLEYLGEEDVYDVTVEDVHAFDANGLYVHNCVEQQLEDAELCCLVETFPAKHDTYEDYLATLKIAYLYGKTVTLANTHWAETNAKMLKNRRIGLSQSGVVQAFNKFGRRQMLNWCDNAYEHVRELDKQYSDWLCIPQSVRMTSIKPSGTVSLLNGSTPGIHYPEDEYYIRRIRFAADSEMLNVLREAGYKVEPDEYSPNTMCVEFPVHEEHFKKGKRELTMWEQLEIAAQYQHYWADNSVSITVTFKPHEAGDIKTALEMYETRLKAVSFLRYEETGYVQAPYEPITREQYEEMVQGITPIQRFSTEEAGEGTKFCDGDSCII